MLELVKKSAFIGVGFAALNVATAKKLGKKLAKEANLSEKEGEKFVADFVAESKRKKIEFRKSVSTSVKETVNEMNLASKEDLEVINKKLDSIERALKIKSVNRTSVYKSTKS